MFLHLFSTATIGFYFISIFLLVSVTLYVFRCITRIFMKENNEKLTVLSPSLTPPTKKMEFYIIPRSQEQ